MSTSVLLLFFSVLSIMDITTAMLPADYETLPSTEKQSILWQSISREPYSSSNLPNDGPSWLSMIKLFYPPYYKKSFTHQSDEMPGTRQKLLHPYGAVAKVELRITDNTTEFTGIFRSGAVGLARLSIAKPSDTDFIPGMGLKMLIDGKPSVNFHVMDSVDGQGKNKNFFGRPFRNIIPSPQSVTLKVLSKMFAMGIWLLPGGTNDRPESETNMPLYEHAAFESNGDPVTEVYAPYEVTFTPNPEMAWSPDTTDDYRVHLQRIPVGSVLYTVALKRALRTDTVQIGELVTSSEFVASRYGDEMLYFRHAQRRWAP